MVNPSHIQHKSTIFKNTILEDYDSNMEMVSEKTRNQTADNKT